MNIDNMMDSIVNKLQDEHTKRKDACTHQKTDTVESLRFKVIELEAKVRELDYVSDGFNPMDYLCGSFTHKPEYAKWTQYKFNVLKRFLKRNDFNEFLTVLSVYPADNQYAPLFVEPLVNQIKDYMDANPDSVLPQVAKVLALWLCSNNIFMCYEDINRILAQFGLLINNGFVPETIDYTFDVIYWLWNVYLEHAIRVLEKDDLTRFLNDPASPVAVKKAVAFRLYSLGHYYDGAVMELVDEIIQDDHVTIESYLELLR